MPTPPSRLLEFVTTFAIGGTENRLRQLVGELDLSRFEPYLGCIRRGGEYLAELEARHLPIVDFPLKRLKSVRAIRQQMRLASWLRTQEIQLVHTFGYDPNVFAIPAAAMAGTRARIASVHDLGETWTGVGKRARTAAENLALRLAHRVIANSTAVRDHLVARGVPGERIEVICNGVDLARFDRVPRRPGVRAELGLSEAGPVVAVVSRLVPVKGPEYFVEAAALVARTHPAAQFLVVGGSADPADDGYARALYERAARLGLGRRIAFTGFRDDIPELLQHVDISVLPSLSEGMPNSVLEAMAARLPVVATRVGGSIEAVVDGVTGCLVPPRDAGALASAIGHLLDRPDLARAWGAEGRRRAEARFSLRAMVQKTEHLYTELLAA
ncbi:MAG TPA: glycosyltransferase [bacterium]|nr:glycosyltransferase [bacterium]